MIGPSREDSKGNGTVDSPEEESLKSVIKEYLLVVREYISFRNLNVFVFMVLSVAPATICQAYFMRLNILDIEGVIYTFFLELDYKWLISPEYDFIIQPVVVLVMLNLGLIGMKLIGWGFEDEEKETIISWAERFAFPVIIIIYLIILAFFGVPLLMWAFLLFLIIVSSHKDFQQGSHFLYSLVSQHGLILVLL